MFQPKRWPVVRTTGDWHIGAKLFPGNNALYLSLKGLVYDVILRPAHAGHPGDPDRRRSSACQ